jgi:hypothetical protein
VRHFVPFLGLFAALHGGDALVPIVEGVQAGLWTMVCESIYTKGLPKLSGKQLRNNAAHGAVALLCKTSAMQAPAFASKWQALLTAAVEGIAAWSEGHTFGDAEVKAEAGAASGGGVEIDEVYSAAYCPLRFATRQFKDPLQPRGHGALALARGLAELSASRPGTVGPMVGACLNAAQQAALQSWMAVAKVALR